ncbi:MAG: LPS assembly lipoprotein LptE [Oricola sp.]
MKKTAARVALAMVTGLALAGCTVQPLYAPQRATGAAISPALAAIYIKPVNDRVGQELRNHLIFLLNNGSGQPQNPAYELALNVRSASKDAAVVQITSSDGEPTARTVTVTAGYRLIRASDGTVVSARRATASASYDVSLQEFANTRAARDAENRAAREVAEQLRALIATDLGRAGAL